jgi:hypothetical protein
MSRINSLELSNSFFDTLVAYSLSDQQPWFSLPGSIPDPRNPSLREYTIDEQKVSLNINMLFAYEANRKSNAKYFRLGGTLGYESKYLESKVELHAHTTEPSPSSTFPDIEVQRFLDAEYRPISGVFDFKFYLPNAYITAKLGKFRVTIGNKKLRWGPGYKGTLALSGMNYSPFYFYHLNLELGKSIYLSSFLCGFDDEMLYVEEVDRNYSMRVRNNLIRIDPMPPRYQAGQRLDIKLGNHVQIGFHELVDFFGTSDLNRFANPLQVYYLGNMAGGTDNSNLLGGCDLNLFFRPFRVYAEFLNDDITVFEHNGNPSKYAYQCGVQYGNPGIFMLGGIEYTHIAPYVYSHSRVLSRHAYWGRSYGWLWGNDQDFFTLYTGLRLHEKLRTKIEMNYWIKGTGTLLDDWYAQGRPDMDNAPYWPQNALKTKTARLSLAYNPFYWVQIQLFSSLAHGNGGFQNNAALYLLMDIPQL